MLKYKILSGLFVAIMFAVLSFGSSMALTSSSSGSTTTPSPSTTQILKVVGLVKKVTATTLYLENNKQYNLTHVKVTYDKSIPASRKKKKKAEMSFVNNVLKEVRIYY